MVLANATHECFIVGICILKIIALLLASHLMSIKGHSIIVAMFFSFIDNSAT